MTDFPGLYRETRERLGARVAGLDDAAARTPVDACPGWDVRAVVSHLTGIVADLQAGRLDGVGTDEWTAAQVSARSDLPMATIVAEWNEKAPALEQQLATWPEDVAGQLLSDATSHELDVRGALGDRDARDTECIRYTFERYAGRLGTRVTEAGLPAVCVVAGEQTVVAGEGDAEVTVRGPTFELVRALAGRRSAAQIRALDWDGDCSPYLAVFSGYGARDTDLVE
jgi:uncharacterized protein (TIGR03083 family)